MAERKVNVSAPKAERKVDTAFTRAFQFWRSLSGEESDAGSSRRRAACPQAQLSTPSPTREEAHPDSDYNSDTEQLSAMKSGANDTHWGPISLSQFTKDWDVYVELFQYQLKDLVSTGSWKTGTVSYTAVTGTPPEAQV